MEIDRNAERAILADSSRIELINRSRDEFLQKIAHFKKKGDDSWARFSTQIEEITQLINSGKLENNQITEFISNVKKYATNFSKLELHEDFYSSIKLELLTFSIPWELNYWTKERVKKENGNIGINWSELTKIDINFSDISPNCNEIDLSLNHISEIQFQNFDNLPHLTKLKLSSNRIYSLSFLTLTNLKELNMSHNNLTRIYNDSFASLTKLESLYLIGNIITEIEQRAFYYNVSLKFLNLSENPIRKICKTMFCKLEKLETLDLWNTKITIVHEWYLPLKSLKILRISNTCRNRRKKPLRVKHSFLEFFKKMDNYMQALTKKAFTVKTSRDYSDILFYKLTL